MKRIVSISLLMFCLPFFLFAQSASDGNGGQRANGYEYVDLGLSVKWATCNVGASSPEEFGGYYQWAGTRDEDDIIGMVHYFNCPYHTTDFEANTGWTKYVPSDESSYWYGSGYPDNKTVLDPRDDVAHVKLGGKWRMPTKAEFDELINNCTWTWTRKNGIAGYRVTSKKPGYTSKSIFLPAAGIIDEDDFHQVGQYGDYWSSSLSTVNPRYAFELSIGKGSSGDSEFELSIASGDVRIYSRCPRYCMLPVRPVLDD